MELKNIELKPFSYHTTGDVDFAGIQASFDSLVEQLNKTIEDLNDEKGKLTYYLRTALVEGTAPVELLESGRTRDVKLVSAFAVAADNLDYGQTLKIADSNGRDLVKPKTIKKTEKSGKTQSFTVYEPNGISRFGDATIIPSSVRKVVVTALFAEV